MIPTNREIVIRGEEGKRPSIAPQNRSWPSGAPLLQIAAGANVTLQNLTIRGCVDSDDNIIKLARGIVVEGGGATTVNLEHVSVMYCNGNNQSGAGLCATGASPEHPGTLNLTGCVFWDNVTSTTLPTSGGAIYIGSNYTVKMEDVEFARNKAHSGGAVYVYNSFVFAKDCDFGLRTPSPGFQNEAGQRGGAVHCHGTMVLKDCTFQRNISNQNGGGIYVSSSAEVQGIVLLDNTSIRNNYALASGGGVYVSSDSTLYLRGPSTVTGNHIYIAQMDDEPWENNIFYTTVSSRVVLLDEQTGEIGVSTANPYDRKLAVHSIGNVGGFADLKERVGQAGYTLDSDETFVVHTAEQKGRISYDSDVWLLKDVLDDPAAAEGHPDVFQQGKLWLKINPSYGVDGGANNVIFDFNLPGRDAQVYKDKKAGDIVPLPTVSNDTSRPNVTFIFKGWYDEPAGGNQITESIEVTDNMGIKVYYAHWEVKVKLDNPPVPGVDQMYLVYFDQNYPGGGVTASYKVAGKFSFNVEYTFENPETGEEETGVKTIEVEIPWGWPGDPARTGYNFQGWAESQTGDPVNVSEWTPTSSVTTLYARWSALPYTITWDANGGNSNTTKNQKYDELIILPTTPTRTGYKFTGWYQDAACTVPLISGTRVTGNATFYAGWKITEYTLRWDTNYTGGAVFSTGQDHGEELITPTDPVREGYKFLGWFTAASGGNKVSTSVTVGGDVTYYAHWEAKTYTLTWNANGGSSDTTKTQKYDELIVLPATPTRTGYKFTGWYQDAACTVPLTSGSRVAGDATFYAGWTAKDYIITWDSNYTNGPVLATGQDHDEKLIIPTDPVREGYEFLGWFTAVDGGNEVSTSTTVEKDVTYYAHWKVKNFKGGGVFDPDATITRAEAVTMINRALDRQPDKEALDTLVADGAPFADVTDQTHWSYYQIMELLYAYSMGHP